jgi:hypothetical protein
VSAFAGLAAVTLAVTSTTGDELKPYDISPGLIGFVVTAAVVVAVIFLMRNMTGRMRRLERRPEPDGEPERRGEPEPGGGAEGPGALGAPRDATDGAGDDAPHTDRT